MRFPRQHHLGQHLIHDRFRLPTTAVPDGRRRHVRPPQRPERAARRDHRADSFDFPLAPAERGVAPGDLLRRAMAPLIELSGEPDGWASSSSATTGTRCWASSSSEGVSEGARALMGPVLNLEGRFHFSLVEWFCHYHEDVFGDLEYIDAGADTLPGAFAPMLMDDARFGAEVHAIEQGPDGVTVRYQTEVGGEGSVAGDECIVTVPLVLLRHMEIGGLDVDKVFRSGTSTTAARTRSSCSSAALVGGRLRASPRRHRHGPGHPERGVHAGRPGPSTAKGVLIASYAWEQDSMAYSMLASISASPRRWRTCAKIHPRGARDVRVRHLPRLGAGPYAGGIGPLFRPFEMCSELLRRCHPPGRPGLVRQRRLRPEGQSLDRGRHRGRPSRTPTPSIPGCATSCRWPRRRSARRDCATHRNRSGIDTGRRIGPMDRTVDLMPAEPARPLLAPEVSAAIDAAVDAYAEDAFLFLERLVTADSTVGHEQAALESWPRSCTAWVSRSSVCRSPRTSWTWPGPASRGSPMPAATTWWAADAATRRCRRCS